MTDIYKLEDMVKDVLEKFEDTRSDDFILIFRVYQKINENVVVRKQFHEVMLNHLEYGLPPFTTIVRCRRKIFKNYPKLKPQKITEIREEQESKIIDYAIDGYSNSFSKFVDSQK